ncbi:MAG: hypothetical protein ACKN85_08885 [Pirellula sp.]
MSSKPPGRKSSGRKSPQERNPQERILADESQRVDDLNQVLGYLNFSSGNTDPKFLSSLNRLYAKALGPGAGALYKGLPAWLTIQQWLVDQLEVLRQSNPAFAQSQQASRVIELVWRSLLPDYLDYHSDLLFHQQPEGVFNGLFLGRAIEAVLKQAGPWDQVDRIVSGAIQQINDYVGYRPVATLEGHDLEPYDHEWVGPIPLFIRGVGVAFGPYYELLERTLKILRETSEGILRAAQFDLGRLDEICMDPRAYDFDHPVNTRPNYYFGQWDPHLVDSSGYYRRFVLQQVTVDALMARVLSTKELPNDELITEAAAVLAGTMLMASGICGASPTSIASTTTVMELLTIIASYRDAFYIEYLPRLEGKHAKRLEAEAKIRRQPLGGARQELNTTLGRLRAAQVERVQVARIFARMGNAQAAKEEADDVQVPSARILCRIDCLLTIGNQLLHRKELSPAELHKAAQIPEQIEDLVRRGIACGALVDPWNILGFGGNFNRFSGSDTSVPDDRVHELVEIMELCFGLLSRIWREAAARDMQDLCDQTESCFRKLSQWWRQFAAHQVSDIHATDPQIALESAQLVARALQLWHRGGASAGDLKFWSPHAQIFDSPKAYALVIEALLDREDFVGSRALLIHWLSQVSRVGISSGSIAYSDFARRWMERLLDPSRRSKTSPTQSWSLIEKFFAYVESNAEEYWQAPVFELLDGRRKRSSEKSDLEPGLDEDDTDNPFGSAYEDFIYKDTTDDGVEGPVYETGLGNDEEFIAESKRIGEHLIFLSGLAHMWKQVAESGAWLCYPESNAEPEAIKERIKEVLVGWIDSAISQRNGLLRLLDQIQKYAIPTGATDADSMTKYDRQRVAKESLIEKILSTAVETMDACKMLLGIQLAHFQDAQGSTWWKSFESITQDDRGAIELYGHLMGARREQVEPSFRKYLTAIRNEPLLYVSLARGGNPKDILLARSRRRTLTHLLTWLPRQGFYHFAGLLIATARQMEAHNHVGHGAVTEFDDLFQIAFKSMVRCLIRNAYQWSEGQVAPKRSKKIRDCPSAVGQGPLGDLACVELENLVDRNLPEPEPDFLVPLLEQLTEGLLGHWLSHSRTLRLSVLEVVDSPKRWAPLSEFIQKYGQRIFTQVFLSLPHVRAILHQGVDNWLQQAMINRDSPEAEPLLDAIDAGEIGFEEATDRLGVVFEAIIDHYAEYKDYNTTTTQSDRGEMLYMFLDFLRLRVRYDRVSWNLKPVFWAHEVLVHTGCQRSAIQWRRALSDRVSNESDAYLEKLQKLQKTYAMMMTSVADRLNERFIKPMTIDRMRALIRPAMRQLRSSDQQESRAFDLLVQELHLMMREPTGVGLEVPAWLMVLQEEVDRVLDQEQNSLPSNRLERAIPLVSLSLEEVRSQLIANQTMDQSLRGAGND